MPTKLSGRAQGERTPAEVRHQMLDNGWNPIRVRIRDKRPADRGWPKQITTHEMIDKWAADEHPRARRHWAGNTGVPGGDLLAIDADTNHEDVTAWVVDMTRDVLGDTPFVRIGNPVRRALVYRRAHLLANVSYDFIRPTSQWKDPDTGLSHRVEVTQRGKQLAVYGIHTSGGPYHWLDANPLDNAWTDLPEVRVARVRKLIETLEDEFEARGFELARGTSGPRDPQWRYDLEPDMVFETSEGGFTAIELENYLKQIPEKQRRRLRIEVYMDPLRETDHNRMTGLAGIMHGVLFIHDFSEDTTHGWADESRRTGRLTVHHTDYSELAAKLAKIQKKDQDK